MLLAPHAQGVVGEAHERPERVGEVRGQAVERLLAAPVEHVTEGRLIGGVGEPVGLALVEHLEGGVEAGGDGVGAQQACAPAVDGGDGRALGLPRVLVVAQLGEALANPGPQLRGRLLGEGDRQDRPQVHVVLAHRGHEALHQHRGLAAPGVGGEQERSGAVLDGGALLGAELDHAAAPLRQIPGY